MEEGKVLGQKNLGQVVEVGEAVDRIKVSTTTVLPRQQSQTFTGFPCSSPYNALCWRAAVNLNAASREVDWQSSDD
jgi:D-arabinose 1-dehydrogenase-like Zn-dependent alcohol dehydrogenase